MSCRCLQSAPTPYSYLQWPQTDGVDDTDQNPQPSDPLQALYLDANGDGQISQSEFENVIGSGADQSKVDELFAKIDSNGDGSISPDEMQSVMQEAHAGHHHHHHHHASDAGSANPLQALLPGASADGTTSQTTTNSDGSTTTTLTYVDGTKIDMTTPASPSDASTNSAASSSDALSFASLLKQLISLQGKLAPPTTILSV